MKKMWGKNSSAIPSSLGLILLGGGASKRFGGTLHKLLCELDGESVLVRNLKTALSLEFVSELVIVAREELVKDFRIALKSLADSFKDFSGEISIVLGGATRMESVLRGMKKISSEVVLIHDMSRPLASPLLFRKVFSAVKEGIGVIPVVECADSILFTDSKRNVKGYHKRDKVKLVQTPQGFLTSEYNTARRILGDKAERFTDDGSLFLSAGYKLKTVMGERKNIKITYPEDIYIAETLLRKRVKQD